MAHIGKLSIDTFALFSYIITWFFTMFQRWSVDFLFYFIFWYNFKLRDLNILDGLQYIAVSILANIQR